MVMLIDMLDIDIMKKALTSRAATFSWLVNIQFKMAGAHKKAEMVG